jgi:hypothetical protein
MVLVDQRGQQGQATLENSEMAKEMAKASTPNLTGPLKKVYT